MKSAPAGLLIAMLLLASVTQAARIEGVEVAEKVRTSDGGPELVLNGAGIRTRFFAKVYVGALYLEQKRTSAAAVFGDDGAKRVAMHMLRDLSAARIQSAIDEGLENNNPPTTLARLAPQMEQLRGILAAVGVAKRGDTILIDYVPGTGTRVQVNGALEGTIPGAEFNRALMRSWLGERPNDRDLKQAMLGRGD